MVVPKVAEEMKQAILAVVTVYGRIPATPIMRPVLPFSAR